MDALDLRTDGDGYPTEITLRMIADAPVRTREDCLALLEAVGRIWRFGEAGYWQRDGCDLFYASTAGWSGNEDVVGALQANTVFWAFCWRSSRRGGHHEFEVPGEPVGSDKDHHKPPEECSSCGYAPCMCDQQ